MCLGVKMRINRNMLLKLAKDSVEKYVAADRTLLAVYMQGSLLGEDPLIGNTADIDLFFVHSDEVQVEREIIKISDEVHLDIAHHSHMLFRQPRELRVHPWLGPTVYGCKIMYDPQHFMNFVQASVRGQFSSPENVLSRVRKHSNHARSMWESLSLEKKPPDAKNASLYLSALEHAANVIAGLSGQILTERRFLSNLSHRADDVHKPGLYLGFLGLLGAPSVEVAGIRAWLPEWRKVYNDLPIDDAPIRLQPARFLYYDRAIETILNSQTPHDVLWPLWRTWTHAILVLPDNVPHHRAWHKAGEQLGLLGAAFTERIEALDAYLDLVDDILDAWARENGE